MKYQCLLNKNEVKLIQLIRFLRFGTLIINVRDGVPQAKIQYIEQNIDLESYPQLDNFIGNFIIKEEE